MYGKRNRFSIWRQVAGSTQPHHPYIPSYKLSTQLLVRAAISEIFQGMTLLVIINCFRLELIDFFHLI